jgi:hypothetical protein
MDTEGLSFTQWILMTIQNAWTATRGLHEFRQAGGHISTATWYRVSAEMRVALGDRVGEFNGPLNQVPTAEEIKLWTTTRARGYIQQVEVLARDKITGEIISIPFSLAGRTLRSRAHAIREALRVYSNPDEKKYPQQILGAVYTGTYQMVPNEG